VSIERGLTQQKLTRQERRHRFSEIDGRHLIKGSAYVNPFALLLTQVFSFCKLIILQNLFI
jgi:hypothetical protein